MPDPERRAYFGLAEGHAGKAAEGREGSPPSAFKKLTEMNERLQRIIDQDLTGDALVQEVNQVEYLKRVLIENNFRGETVYGLSFAPLFKSLEGIDVNLQGALNPDNSDDARRTRIRAAKTRAPAGPFGGPTDMFGLTPARNHTVVARGGGRLLRGATNVDRPLVHFCAARAAGCQHPSYKDPVFGTAPAFTATDPSAASLPLCMECRTSRAILR